jgi:hypothetical protein
VLFNTKSLVTTGASVVREAAVVYLALLKILLPAVIVVKILQETGAVNILSDVMAPLMSAIGLPAVISIVWATTLLTNIYTGMVVFFAVAPAEPLTVAQVTILGALMLLGHSIIVEGAVAKRIGVSWALAQCKAIASIFFIILFLVVLLRLVRFIGLDKLLHRVMYPVLRLIGVRRGEVSRDLSEMTMVGATLGLTFGAGLLIRQRQEGGVSPRNCRVAGSFIGVCHGLIDDTLLVLLLGANLGVVLFGRIAFAVLLIAVLTRVMDWCCGLRASHQSSG